ncbi:MAG: hypothetical protein LBP71_06190 [Spirochaetaceae bacterium]|nr:hypothetical protein [Spirochaetaceae bacterium]
MVKLTGAFVILTLFGSCMSMTIIPDNRSEALRLLKEWNYVSVSSFPLENAEGPVFKISGSFLTYDAVKHELMAAGQTGMEFDYKYFFILARDARSIIVVYTNDENHENHYLYNAYECSSLLDGHTIFY